MVREHRRGRRAVVDALPPDDSAGCGIEGVEVPFERADVDAPIRNRRWKLDHAARIDPPNLPEWRPVPEGRQVRSLQVTAIGRPRLPAIERALISKPRRELDRRGAAHVARARFVPGPCAE